MTTTVPKSMTTEVEVLGAANVGTGEAGVFKDKSGENLRFRTLKAGANITITENADDITITSSGGGGGGLPGGGNAGLVLSGTGAWSNDIDLDANDNAFAFRGGIVTFDQEASGGGFYAYGIKLVGEFDEVRLGSEYLNFLGSGQIGFFNAAGTVQYGKISVGVATDPSQRTLVIDAGDPTRYLEYNLATGSLQLIGPAPILSVGTAGSGTINAGTINADIAASRVTSGQLAAARLAAGTASEGYVPKVVSGVVTWAADATGGGGGISDGNKGDITVSGSGSSWQINAGSVSTSELADQGVTPAKLNRATGPSPSSSGYYRGNGEWRNFFADSNAWSNANQFSTSATNVSTDFRIPSASNSLAGITLSRSCRPANDRSGALNFITTRDGGSAQNNALIDYRVTAALTTGFDIGFTTLATYTNLQGGFACGAWLNAFSPSDSLGQTWSSGAVFAVEINYGNRWAELGLQEDRLGTRWIGGLQIVPDVVGAFDGGGSTPQYNASFGIILAKAGDGAKTHIPFYIETDATAVDGYAMKVSGGSTSGNKAAFLLKAGGHFNQGIDFSGVTFADTENRAILLGGSQAIEFGNGRIWYDVATQKMKVYDPTGGTRDL